MALKQRRWRTWPGRFSIELNGVNGVFSIGGAILAILAFAGYTGLSDLFAGGTGVVGVLITVGAVVYAGWKSLPRKLYHPRDFVGQEVPFEQLDHFYPPLRKLSVIGPEMSGKSTLLKLILAKAPPDDRTQKIYAYVAALPHPDKYIAILDGPGRSYAAQFIVAEPADLICILLDLNNTDDQKVIVEERLAKHKEFSAQLRDYLSRTGQKQPAGLVHLLMNKRDLWESLPPKEQQKLKTLLATEEAEWAKSNCAKVISSGSHSNWSTVDMGKFQQIILDYIIRSSKN